MGGYYLAVDIGASSGRHILGRIQEGVMELEEVYRFENGMTSLDGSKVWDTGHLFGEILNGMRRCRELGKIPVSMSIDTWAVDYVLLDEKDHILGSAYGYRDKRTERMDQEVYRLIREERLYERTGIQKQIFNTIYQLMAVKKQAPEVFSQAKTFLMLPDYFQFLLTGNKTSEYTNATTTQLVSPETGQWDGKLLDLLGYPQEWFLPLSMPGTWTGRLLKNVQDAVGYDLDVVCCASHDTASAVMAMPKEDSIYISSGTWSLMGVETERALCDPRSREANFTNEGGYDRRFRYLKNIMGLWMIQSVRHELNDAYSFEELCVMAGENEDFPSLVDVNDERFLAPDSMTEAVKSFCKETGQPAPETAGEIASVIYRSLADCYGRTVQEIEQLCGHSFSAINVIGGGSKADYLNRLTVKATGKTVCAGPGEATAVGNLMAQMIRKGEFEGLGEARKCVSRSFDIKVYENR